MFGNKSRWLVATVLGAALCHPAAWAEAERKVVSKVQPTYPQLARQMNVVGMVKIEVVIAANGSVKSVKPLGGHPLLIQAASDALRKWRYAPGPETTTVVEFNFHSAAN
jgi:TonB family protein